MLLAVRSTSSAAASENATRELMVSAMSNPSELVHGRDMAPPHSCCYWPHGQGAPKVYGECWLHIRLITTSRARTWRWRRMRRYGERSRGAERSSPRQFFPDCTIAMCGYDFREGQEFPFCLSLRLDAPRR